MHWLVTFAKGVTAEKRCSVLASMACKVTEDSEPIEVGDDIVVEVEGPADLPARGRAAEGVKAVHPSSEYSLYAEPS